MRELTDSNLPFSFSFFTYSETEGKTNGIKKIERALLRPGYTAKQSDKKDILIGYYDLDKEKNGWAYLPLILSINEIPLQ